MPVEVFRRYMVVFGAGPFDILTCLELNPFDAEVVRRFQRACKHEAKDPTRVLQNLMRFYVVS